MPRASKKTLDFEFPEFSEADIAVSEEGVQRELAEVSFYEFVKQAWHVVEPGHPYVDGWHIWALCAHLEQVYCRNIRKLLVNMPPRMSKSIIISILFPTWVWLKNPHLQIINGSYSEKLSSRNCAYFSKVICSEWFQARWGHLFTLIKNRQDEVVNNYNGYYMAFAVKGTLTGFGGDIKICDDPNNAEKRESETVLNNTNDWLSAAWGGRYQDPNTVCEILVQQRLNVEDATGFILRNDKDRNKWVKMIMPMRFDPERRAKTIILPGCTKPWEDPREKPGELLCPQRIGEKELVDQENTLRAKGGEYEVSGQMQQLPAPNDSGILKRSSFVLWKKEKAPGFRFIISSWDTSLGKDELSAFTAVTTWGLFQTPQEYMALMLLGRIKVRVEFPEMEELAIRLSKDYRDDGGGDIEPDGIHKTDIMLIEDASSGSPLIQSLRRKRINVVSFIPPKLDKTGRARVASSLLESGQIWLPATPKSNFEKPKQYAEDFAEDCTFFPVGPTKDVVDTFSQVCLYLLGTGDIQNRLDPKFKGYTRNKLKKPFYSVN